MWNGMEILQGRGQTTEYYTIREAAQLLGLSTKTIRNWIDRKQIEAVWNDIGKGRSHWLIAKELIEQRLSNQPKAINPRIIGEEAQLIPVSIENAAIEKIVESISIKLQDELQVLHQENLDLKNEIKLLREEQQDKHGQLLKLLKEKRPWWKVW